MTTKYNENAGAPLTGIDGVWPWQEGLPLTGKSCGSVTAVTLDMGVHANRSGYGRLVDRAKGRIIPSTDPKRLLPRIAASVFAKQIVGSGSRWYNRASFTSELQVASQWLKANNQLFHFLYGENLYRYTGHLKRLRLRPNNRLVATYHTPTWRLHEVVRQQEHLKALDAVIVMSRSQIPYFREELELEQVHFIPHGIDTDYFCSVEKRPTQNPTFLTVGSHLRDFKTVSAVAKQAWTVNRDIRFVVVSDPQKTAIFSDDPNVTCLSGVSDNELRSLYQESTALFLPLLDATANNTILEALACGLAIITSDLAGVHDYVDDKCALTAPAGDTEAHFELLRAVAEGEIDYSAMGAAARQTAERYSWENVALATDQVYARLLDSGSAKSGGSADSGAADR